jgi:hypothetical protein
LQKKNPEEFLSQSFEEMQVHKVLRKKLLPYFQLPCKKKPRVIVVVRLIYVICTKDGGGGGALAHTYYSVAAWPV